MKKILKLRLSLLLVSLFIGICIVTYWFYNQLHEKDLLTLQGNVDIRQVELGFRVGGRLIEMHFEEGDNVTKGAILAKLDQIPYIEQRNTAASRLKEAQAQLLRTQRGNRPQEIQEARARLREKEVNYNNAQRTANRQGELIKKNYTSKQTYEDALAQANEADAQRKTAEESLKLSEEGFRQEEIDAAKARVEATTSELANAQINLEDTVLYAPSNGVILTRVREIGAVLASGEPVYAFSLTSPVWIRCYVSEIELGHIKPGMVAQVFTDSHPHRPLTGQIGFISPQAEFTPKTVETTSLRPDLVYRLRVVVEDPQSQLRQGMPVTVQIKLPHD